MILGSFALFLFIFLVFLSIVRFLSKTSTIFILLKACQSFTDRFQVYQYYKVPQYNEHFQENQLYQKISTYLNSLPSVEDSDFTNLLSGSKPSEIFYHLDTAQPVHDTFLGARVFWSNQKSEECDGIRSFVLKIKKSDKRRIFRQYFQHILSISDEIEQRKKEIKLYMNSKTSQIEPWRSVPFSHTANFDTVVLDSDLKSKVKSDLEQFMKSKQYYHRLGRVWKRSYLLYGPSGTGKTSFVAAMARLLCYDIYAIDMSKVADDSCLTNLLLRTTSQSMILIEDLDRYLKEKSMAVTISGLLNFMDGIISSFGEERVLVFTMNDKDQIDQAVLRPGRIDVHIQFPLCDFPAFKSLASSYLGVKEHKLFPQVEEIFQSGVSLSPAEVCEIMISNRSSPSRALKSIISAMQSSKSSNSGQRLSRNGSNRSGDESGSGESESVICRESINTVKEFRKLYGLLKMGSRRKEEPPIDLVSSTGDKEGSRHGR